MSEVAPRGFISRSVGFGEQLVGDCEFFGPGRSGEQHLIGPMDAGSLIAGGLTTIVLLVMGVPYAVALGLIVAILDLIPLAGATLAAIIVGAVAFLHSIPAGIIVIVFFILYQQVENHILQPVVYGRTVQLSPLVVLISVLIGAELAGVLGALAAIPVAGSLQVVFVDWLRHRRGEQPAGAT